MGFARGPKIETDGLVLYLDAANKKSLEGEPTVNLLPKPTFSDGVLSPWQYQQTEYGNVSVVSDVYKSDGYSVRVERTSNTGEANCWLSVTSYGTKPNTEYTFSVDVLCSTPNAAKLLTYLGSVNAHSPYHSGSGQWERLSLQCTTDSNGLVQVRFGIMNPNTLTHAYFDNVQLEEKSYATPFVNGTRDAWKDLSKNKNNITLIGNPIKTTNYGGGLSFNGIDEFGVFDNPEILTDFTAEFVFNVSSYGGGWAIFLGNSDTDNFIGYTNYYFRFQDDASVSNDYGNSDLNFNELNILQVTHSGETTKWYFNNNYLGEKTFSTAYSGVTFTHLIHYATGNALGVWAGEYYLCRLYNKALNTNQLQGNYNATKSRYGL